MSFSEGFRQRLGEHKEQGSLGQAKAELDLAERRAAYSAARLAELGPMLREQSRLEAEGKAADNRLAHALEIVQLAEQLDRLRQRTASQSTSGPEPGGVAKARLAVAEAQAAKQSSSDALTANRETVSAKDAELKVRFGLG